MRLNSEKLDGSIKNDVIATLDRLADIIKYSDPMIHDS